MPILVISRVEMAESDLVVELVTMPMGDAGSNPAQIAAGERAG